MSEKESSKRIRLKVEGGPTREFPGDRTFVIGRSQNVDFSIPHPNLSREHVRISLKNGDVWMEDLGSANGTFVQGQRIPSKSQVKIKPHYRILLGTGSNVVISLEAVDESEEIQGSFQTSKSVPKGDSDLPSSREVTFAEIPRDPSTQSDKNDSSRETAPRGVPTQASILSGHAQLQQQFQQQQQQAAQKESTQIRDRVREEVREHTKTMGTGLKKAPSKGYELDFPQQHFPQEAKKEKLAELRIIEAKKQRVIEDIQYKEREVEDLRAKIRTLREESLKLKEATDAYKREIAPLEEKRVDLEARVAELDVVYEEKIDALETGFQDLKTTLEESHGLRMARADKDFKEKTKRLDEEYSRKLHELESGTQAIRAEGDRLREQVTKERKELEDNLKKVRGEAEALEAERRLTQVRIDTETAKLQGAKLKLENELETVRRERERVGIETQNAVERGKIERQKLEEARKAVEMSMAERDSVLRSIEETKLSEEKNLKRIEEMRTQVATLETRAQSIENMIRQAERDSEAMRKKAAEDAEAHRRQVYAEVEAYKKRAIEESDTYRKRVFSEAETYKKQVTEEADAYRKVTADQADAERQAVKKNAEAQAVAHVQAADSQGKARLQAVEAQCHAMIERAKVEADAFTDRASSEGKAMHDRLKAEADAYAEERKAAGEAAFNEAQSKASAIELNTRSLAEKTSMEMSAQLDQKKKAIENELAELRRRADQEVRQVRASALSEIEAAKEREAKDFTNRVSRRTKEIGDQIDRVVGAKLSAQFGVNMDPVSLKAFSDEIHSIVDNILSPNKGQSSSAKEATFSTILPVNTQARDKAARYWKKMGVAAAVAFVLILSRALAPGMYASIGRGIGKALEVKDNTDEVVRKMLRERQLAMTFVTEQDQQFRDSYTDNVLYTEGFIEMKEDVETQKTWTLELNKFFQEELGLTEKAIVQFGSAEGRMFRELLDTRKSLTPQTSSGGIQKMHEIEAGYVKEMKFVVRTDSAWQKFQAFHRAFYVKYTQSFSNRAPASTQK